MSMKSLNVPPVSTPIFMAITGAASIAVSPMAYEKCSRDCNTGRAQLESHQDSIWTCSQPRLSFDHGEYAVHLCCLDHRASTCPELERPRSRTYAHTRASAGGFWRYPSSPSWYCTIASGV